MNISIIYKVYGVSVKCTGDPRCFGPKVTRYNVKTVRLAGTQCVASLCTPIISSSWWVEEYVEI